MKLDDHLKLDICTPLCKVLYPRKVHGEDQRDNLWDCRINDRDNDCNQRL